MADAVLLRRVQLGGSLAALRQKKKRIVTEAARAARRARDLASPDALGDQRPGIGWMAHQDHGAAVIRFSLSGKIHQQLLVVPAIPLLAAAFAAGVIRRMRPRLP